MSALVEAHEPIENGGGLSRYFDFEPCGPGEGDKAEFQEGATRLLASREIHRNKRCLVAVYEPKASAAIGSYDLDYPTAEEVPPLLDPSFGVIGGELTCDGYACHMNRLATWAQETGSLPLASAAPWR
jgi:hypothetical protein